MGGGGKLIGGEQLFILEDHPERNELRVLTAEEAFKNNIAAFSYCLQYGLCVYGYVQYP